MMHLFRVQRIDHFDYSTVLIGHFGERQRGSIKAYIYEVHLLIRDINFGSIKFVS